MLLQKGFEPSPKVFYRDVFGVKLQLGSLCNIDRLLNLAALSFGLNVSELASDVVLVTVGGKRRSVEHIYGQGLF